MGEHEVLPNGTFIELYLGFHLIKVYIYVKILVRWMCQWSEYTLIIYKYALYIYIYKFCMVKKKKKLYKREKTSRERPCNLIFHLELLYLFWIIIKFY